jgi:hypothetical protein
MAPDDETIQEPENSTVDDWFGQNVARDQDVADKVAAESDSEEEAEARFEEEAEGEDTYEAGHPRPEGGPAT